MIDRQTIERIREAADIVEVVREFVSLRKAGVNYKGLCPFHNEKTPSFVVSPAKGICHCFSCGKGGDAIHFLMEIEQLSYPEAIKWLGRKYGIEVREKELTADERQAASLRESMFVVNEWARDYFEDQLHHSADGVAIGMAYLRKRGLRDDIIRKFQIGYSPEQRDALARAALAKGYKREFLVKTGLCFETKDHSLLDRYHGRIIFPVHSVSGKIVAFGGRILGNQKNIGKYVNSPESEIYSKSRELYGLYLAKKAIVRQGRCFMVEGYMDVIAMHQSGVENVVASSGTSLTEGQIRLLHRFTENITVLYDGDAAGIHASLRGIDMLLAEGLNVKVLLLPDGDDPDSFAGKHNPEEFRKYLDDHQTDFITFKTNLLLEGAGSDPIKRAALVTDIVRSISVIPDGIVRQTYAHECARLMDMDERLILSEVSKLRREATTRPATERTNASTAQPAVALAAPVATQTAKSDLLHREERLLAQQIIRYGDLAIEQPGEDGTTVTTTVAEYIANDLAQDNLAFQDPLYARILAEALQHAGEADFKALPYFLNHPDAAISQLAADLGTRIEQLSSNQQLQYGKEADHLPEVIPHLLTDFKYAVVARERKQVQEQIRRLTATGDYAALLPLMERFRELNRIFAAVSRAAGNKVVPAK